MSCEKDNIKQNAASSNSDLAVCDFSQVSNFHGVPHHLAEHGPPVDHQTRELDEVEGGSNLWWSRVRHYCCEPFSEFFGVFILVLFGDGVVAQVVLSSEQKGNYQSITWGWGCVTYKTKLLP
jgi:hypothetical protein